MNFFDQDEPDMVDDKYHPGEIEKNNPEKELTQKRENDLLYHKSKIKITRYPEKLRFKNFIAMEEKIKSYICI